MGWNCYVSISPSAGKVSWIIIIIIFCEIIFITLLRNCVDKAAVHGRLRPRHPLHDGLVQSRRQDTT